MRDSDRIIGLLDSRTRRAENGQCIEKQLLLTRFDPQRSSRGEMLSVEDVLEILSIPLLGIIPESEEMLRASNLGAPITMNAGKQRGGQRLHEAPRAGWPAKRSDGSCPSEKKTLPQPPVRPEGGMSLFNMFKARATAPVARERLQILLAHERVALGPRGPLAMLRDEIIATIARHIEIDPEKVMVQDGPRRLRSRRSRSTSRFRARRSSAMASGGLRLRMRRR